MPCLQSVGISSCLSLCCSSISFSLDLCSISQKLRVSVISNICDCVLASNSGQISLVCCFPGKNQKIYMRLLPGIFISDVVQPGLPSCPSQHPHFGSIQFALIFLFYGPTFITMCHCWSGDCFEDFVFQFHGHLPIAHYPGYFFPPSTRFLFYCWHQPVNLNHS